jgi:hypothetical protein
MSIHFTKYEIEAKFGSFATQLLEQMAWENCEIEIDGKTVKAYFRVLHFSYLDIYFALIREIKCDEWFSSRYGISVE